TVLARFALPRMAALPGAAQVGSRAPLPFRNRRLVTLCVLTLIGVTAHFASYTFIVPIVRDLVGIRGQTQAWLLGAYGVAGLITMLLLARAMDHRLRAVVVCSLTVLCLAFWSLGALAVFGADVLAMTVGVAAVMMWGASAAALPPMLQSAAIRTAPEEPEQASALYVTSFQVGILAGSVAGAVVYQHANISAVVAMSCALFAVTLVGVILRPDAFRGHAEPSAHRELDSDSDAVAASGRG
ncbi:MAG TPA: MFS transporter, partial [Mycobacterium sp.]|nr:MFS transporter [Mycobacterium sp.]